MSIAEGGNGGAARCLLAVGSGVSLLIMARSDLHSAFLSYALMQAESVYYKIPGSHIIFLTQILPTGTYPSDTIPVQTPKSPRNSSQFAPLSLVLSQLGEVNGLLISWIILSR
jgi:hypothetical protein